MVGFVTPSSHAFPAFMRPHSMRARVHWYWRSELCLFAKVTAHPLRRRSILRARRRENQWYSSAAAL